jgi:hypothetical protein
LKGQINDTQKIKIEWNAVDEENQDFVAQPLLGLKHAQRIK